MVFAQIGPLTMALEVVATAVGAGILLGSFATGVVGLLAGWPRRVLEARAFTDGYIGGVFGVAFALLDLILRYSR